MSEHVTRKLTIKTVFECLVAIPVFHLIVTGLYLIGYHLSAGGRLYVFTGTSDIFSASIADVGPTYISVLTLPIFVILWIRASSGAWTDQEAALLQPEGEARETALRKFRSSKKIFRLQVLLLLAAQILFCGMFYFRWGYIPIGLLGFMTLLLFAMGNVWFANRLNIPSPWFHVTFLVGAALLLSVFGGLSRGQIDRRYSYAEAISVVPTCRGFAILRPLGDKFLAISRENRHLVVDSSCQPFASLP